MSFIRHSRPAVANTCSRSESHQTCWAEGCESSHLSFFCPCSLKSCSTCQGMPLPTLQQLEPQSILGEVRVLLSSPLSREEAEAQRGEASYPRSHSCSVVKPGIRTQVFRLQSWCSTNSIIPAFKAEKQEDFVSLYLAHCPP